MPKRFHCFRYSKPFQCKGASILQEHETNSSQNNVYNSLESSETWLQTFIFVTGRNMKQDKAKSQSQFLAQVVSSNQERKASSRPMKNWPKI